MVPTIGMNTVLTVWGMTVTSRVMTATIVMRRDVNTDNSVEQVVKMRLARYGAAWKL